MEFAGLKPALKKKEEKGPEDQERQRSFIYANVNNELVLVEYISELETRISYE